MHLEVSNKIFRQQSFLIFFVSALIILSVFIFVSMSILRFNDTQAAWEKHNQLASTISSTIADLSQHMGYGGFIHNFKNLVIRRDVPRYQPIIEKNIIDLNNDLDRLTRLLDHHEELDAINQLRNTFSEYITKYHLCVSMINQGKSTAEIDSDVKVDDTAALAAKALLVSSISNRSILAQQKAEGIQKEALNFLKTGGLVIFIALLSATITIIIFLRRLITANRISLLTQQRLDNLLDTAPDPMISVSTSGHIVRANHMATKLFGYSHQELMDMEIERLIPERFRNHHRNYRTDFFAKPRNRFISESENSLLALTRDGQELNVEVSLSYSDTDSGRIVTAAIRDVTTQLKTRAALLNARATRMESIGYLTAGVAHHLNNILSAILGYTELSRQDVENKKSGQIDSYLDEISKAGTRAKILIQQMLTYSCLSSIDNKEKTQSTTLSTIVDEIIPFIRSSLPDTVELKYDINDKDMTFGIHHLNLQNILFNLIMNSRDALTDRGKIHITFAKQRYSENLCHSCNDVITGDYLTISVRDNGNGISQADISHIFDPFFTTHSMANSSGMGLSVVHGLVHAHNGHILVESNTQTYTNFVILLPLIPLP